jgi:hypothetical protein
MPATPLHLSRVLRDAFLIAGVDRILSLVKPSTEERHGITIRPNKRGAVRALVYWGDFPPNGDALAKSLRAVLGERWQVSQCRSPDSWGKFRTATEENSYDY